MGHFSAIDVESNSASFLGKGQRLTRQPFFNNLKHTGCLVCLLSRWSCLELLDFLSHFIGLARLHASSPRSWKRRPKNVWCSRSWFPSLQFQDTVSEADQWYSSSSWYSVGRSSVCGIWRNDLHVECYWVFCIEAMNAATALGYTFSLPVFPERIRLSGAPPLPIKVLYREHGCFGLYRELHWQDVSVVSSHNTSESAFPMFRKIDELQRFYLTTWWSSCVCGICSGKPWNVSSTTYLVLRVTLVNIGRLGNWVLVNAISGKVVLSWFYLILRPRPGIGISVASSLRQLLLWIFGVCYNTLR